MERYSASSSILGQGHATPEQITDYFRTHSASGLAYVRRVTGPPNLKLNPIPEDIGPTITQEARFWESAGHLVNHDLVVAQIGKESAFFQSMITRRKNNPSGLGAENNDPEGKAKSFATLRDGIRATIAHLLTYAAGPGPWTEFDPRAHATPGEWQGTTTRLIDLNGRWAFPGLTYGQDIARRANDLLAGSPNVYTIPIHDCYIAEGRKNRPGLTLVPRFITVHETANTSWGANAKAHCDYIRSDAAANRPASWHVTVDDREAYRHIPENEIAWHAGDGSNGTGNRQSLSIELCVNEDGDWEQTKRNAAEIVRQWMVDYSIPRERVVMHGIAWNPDTSCPVRMRAGDWEQFTNRLSTSPLKSEQIEVPGLGVFTLAEPILSYWRREGGVATMGYPISEVVTWSTERGDQIQAQWFERARLENHNGLVLRGRVGAELLDLRHQPEAENLHLVLQDLRQRNNEQNLLIDTALSSLAGIVPEEGAA